MKCIAVVKLAHVRLLTGIVLFDVLIRCVFVSALEVYLHEKMQASSFVLLERQAAIRPAAPVQKILAVCRQACWFVELGDRSYFLMMEGA